MKKQTEQQEQQQARLQELLNIAKQRYLNSGGDPKRCPSGRQGDDYMTDAERQEAILLMRQNAGVRVIGDKAYCQGRSWEIKTSTTFIGHNDTYKTK